MRGGQCGAELTLEMRLGERRGDEGRGGVEPGATWLHTNIGDPCTSALKGTRAQGRKAGIGAHTETVPIIAGSSTLDMKKGRGGR